MLSVSVPIRAAACAICSRGRDGKAGRSTPRQSPSGSVQASTIPPNDAGLCRHRRRPSKKQHQLCPRDIRSMTTASAIVPSGLRHAMPPRRGAEVLACSLAVVARSVLISASPGGAPDLRGKRCRAPTGDRLGGLARVFAAAHESVTSHEANDREMPYSPVGQSRFARGYGVPSLRWNSLTPSGPAFSSRSISG